MRLVAEPLNAGAFAPFGHVLDGAAATAVSVNEGRATRRDLAHFDRGGGQVTLARYDVIGSALPLEVGLLERHPRSEQCFFHLSGAPALVVAAGTGPNGSPDLSRARAFIAGPGTPFSYAAGTWHAPLFALGGDAAFLMGMRESGTPADCEIFELTTALRVEL